MGVITIRVNRASKLAGLIGGLEATLPGGRYTGSRANLRGYTSLNEARAAWPVAGRASLRASLPATPVIHVVTG